MIRTGILIGLIVITFSGCGKNEASKVIAEAGDKKITQGEFDTFAEHKSMVFKSDAIKQRAIEDYTEREALTAVMEKENYLDPEKIRIELNEFKKEMVISRYFETYLKEKVTAQAVKNYYNTHASDYETEKANAAHVLIRINKKMSEIERKAKLTRAQEAYSKLIAGESFKSVAENYSEDNVSKQKGGDLGWVKKGSISKKFSKILFNLTPGKVSEPFETPFGYHVLTLKEPTKKIRQPFETVAGNIRYMLREKAKKAEVKRLKDKMKITYPKV